MTQLDCTKTVKNIDVNTTYNPIFKLKKFLVFSASLFQVILTGFKIIDFLSVSDVPKEGHMDKLSSVYPVHSSKAWRASHVNIPMCNVAAVKLKGWHPFPLLREYLVVLYISSRKGNPAPSLMGKTNVIESYQGSSTGRVIFIQKAVSNKVVGQGASLTQVKILYLQLPLNVFKTGLSRDIKIW